MRVIDPLQAGVWLMGLVLACGANAQGPPGDGARLFERGEYAAAEKALEGRDDARSQVFLALTRAATGRCAEARPRLETAFREDESGLRRYAGLALARCAIADQRFDEATPYLYALERVSPDDADTLYEIARLHLKAWNGAVERMFERAPASFRVNQMSAEIFEIQGKYGEAIAEYRKAIERSPRTLNLHYRLGRALLMHSHEPEALEEARREFEAELTLNPNDAVAEYQIAQILEAQQKPGEARERLERAVELDPDFPEALVALGRGRASAGRHDEAIELLGRAIELAPQSEAAHYALMLAYRNAGRREEALAVKEKLDELQRPPEGEFTDFLKRIGETPEP